jgi:hypothetical protein
MEIVQCGSYNYKLHGVNFIAIYNELCSKIFVEYKVIAYAGYPDTLRDLFMEQGKLWRLNCQREDQMIHNW